MQARTGDVTARAGARACRSADQLQRRVQRGVDRRVGAVRELLRARAARQAGGSQRRRRQRPAQQPRCTAAHPAPATQVRPAHRPAPHPSVSVPHVSSWAPLHSAFSKGTVQDQLAALPHKPRRVCRCTRAHALQAACERSALLLSVCLLLRPKSDCAPCCRAAPAATCTSRSQQAEHRQRCRYATA